MNQSPVTDPLDSSKSYSFADAVEQLSESATSPIQDAAHRILQREHDKQAHNNMPDGCRNPITIMTDLSPDELKTVEMGIREDVHKCFPDTTQVPTQTPVTLSVYPSAAPCTCTHSAPFMQQIFLAKSNLPAESSTFDVFNAIIQENSSLDSAGNPVNPYTVMKFLLQWHPIRTYQGKFYILSDAVYVPLPTEDLRSMIFQAVEPMLASGKNVHIIDTVLSMLRDYGKIKLVEEVLTPGVVHFLNGSYDICSKQFAPVAPQNYLRSYIPVPFMYDAVCPQFDRYLTGVSGGDPVTEELILEMIGYLISDDMGAKVFFVMQGKGDTGKSVLGSLLTGLFNQDSVSNLDIFKFKERFSPSALLGKKLNISMDLPEGKVHPLAMGVIKQITGGDRISAEIKYGGTLTLAPTCKLVFGSNYPLMPATDDPAFRSRLVTIPFRYPVPKDQQDKGLLDKLLAERCGIVIKAMDAYLRLCQRNYVFPSVEESAMLTGYVDEGSTLSDFIATHCVLAPSVRSHTDDLFSAYNFYRAGKNQPPVSDKVAFSRSLSNLLGEKISSAKFRLHGRSLNGYIGIALNDQV